MVTQVKVVRGIQQNGKDIKMISLRIHYTQDQSGGTLSFDNGEIQLSVDAKTIRKIIGK